MSRITMPGALSQRIVHSRHGVSGRGLVTWSWPHVAASATSTAVFAIPSANFFDFVGSGVNARSSHHSRSEHVHAQLPHHLAFLQPLACLRSFQRRCDQPRPCQAEAQQPENEGRPCVCAWVNVEATVEECGSCQAKKRFPEVGALEETAACPSPY